MHDSEIDQIFEKVLSGVPKLNFSGPAGGSRTTRVHSLLDTNIQLTRRAFLSLRVLTIYNTATGEICSSDGPFFCFSKIHFLTSSLVVLDFTINSNGFLAILKFISCSKKITSRSPIFLVVPAAVLRLSVAAPVVRLRWF